MRARGRIRQPVAGGSRRHGAGGCRGGQPEQDAVGEPLHFDRPCRGRVTVMFSSFLPGLTSKSIPEVCGFENLGSTVGSTPWDFSFSPTARGTTTTRYLPGSAPSLGLRVPHENVPSLFRLPWALTLLAPSA